MSNCLFFILSMDLHWLGCVWKESSGNRSDGFAHLCPAFLCLMHHRSCGPGCSGVADATEIWYATQKTGKFTKIFPNKTIFWSVTPSRPVDISRRFGVPLLCGQYISDNTKDNEYIWQMKEKIEDIYILSYGIMSSGTQLPTFRSSLVPSGWRNSKNFSRQYDQYLSLSNDSWTLR